jgi:hypothetical protein
MAWSSAAAGRAIGRAARRVAGVGFEPTTLQVVIPAPRRWRELGHDLQGATGP